MKNKKIFLLSLIVALCLAITANAQVTGGSIFGGALTNLVNQVTGILGLANGGSNANTAQGALNNFFNTPNGSDAPIVAGCNNSVGAENTFTNVAVPAAQSQHTSVLYGGVTLPCHFFNQWLLPADTVVSLFTWGGGAIDYNTAISAGGSKLPYLDIESSAIAQNAIGAAAIDMHGARQFNLNAPYIWGTSLSEPATMIENSIQDSTCCASNNLTITGGGLGSMAAIFGAALDGNLNPIAAGGVYSGTVTAIGTSYAAGTYNKVALTGGSGTTAFADTITVGTSGSVTGVVLRDGIGIQYPGKNYVVNDVLSATDASLGGGGGSGFQFTVNGLTKATTTTPNVLPRFIDTQFSDIGTCIMCNNFSDAMVWGFQFSGGAGVAVQPIYGGGGLDFGPGRAEFWEKVFLLGGPNSSGLNPARIHDITFDFTGQNYDTAYRTLNRSSIEIDSGEGYSISNIMATRSPAADPFIKLGGTGANAKLKNVLITGFNYPSDYGPGSSASCIEINNGGDGTVPDNVIIDDLNCYPGNDATPVKYNVIPTHSFENSFGSQHLTDSTHTGLGEMWDNYNRPWGIGPTAPHAVAYMALDLTSTTTSIGIPVGTTGQRPTAAVGELRVNTTIPAVEAYYNGTWNTLGTGSGSGTVTSVSVTTANGVSGSVATATTTPAITLTLGAITPTTVNGVTIPTATDTAALLGTTQTYTKSQRVSPVTDSISTATFTPDFSASNNHNITLVHASCPCTLANPTNIVAGQSGQIVVNQSATGSDLINTYGGDYVFTNNSAPTLSAGANATDVLSYYVIDSTHIRLSPVISTPATNTTTNAVLSNGTKFTTSGCSVSATTGGATAGKYTSGTTGTCTVVLTMNGATGLTAPNGWSCSATDLTTAADALQGQTASSTTTATISGTTVSGDVVSFFCMGY